MEIRRLKTTGSQNTADYWTLVLDKNGAILSQNIFGGTSDDALTCVAPSAGGGFYAAGSSYSTRLAGSKTLLPSGNNDYWIALADASSKKVGEFNFGGNRSDYLSCMQALADGIAVDWRYIQLCQATSDKSGAFLGVTDFWMVKTNADGTKNWDKTIGGDLGDYLVSVQPTKDKGFLLGGYSNSGAGNDKTEASRGGNDFWIVKTDSLGNIMWDKTLGGNGDDKLAGAFELDSNEYIVAGTSASAVSGDKTSVTVGATGAADFWLVRLHATSVVLPVSLISFTGTLQQQHVALSWKVANSINISRYEVERSTDAVVFATIAAVPSLQNGSTSVTYRTLDSNAASLPVEQLYYRLKIVDNSGAITYSQIIPVRLLSGSGKDFLVLPNPVKNIFTVQYSSISSRNVSFKLFASNGSEVMRATVPAVAGVNVHSFSVGHLPKGAYYLVMNGGNKNEQVTKVIMKE